MAFARVLRQPDFAAEDTATCSSGQYIHQRQRQFSTGVFPPCAQVEQYRSTGPTKTQTSNIEKKDKRKQRRFVVVVPCFSAVGVEFSLLSWFHRIESQSQSQISLPHTVSRVLGDGADDGTAEAGPTPFHRYDCEGVCS